MNKQQDEAIEPPSDPVSEIATTTARGTKTTILGALFGAAAAVPT